MPVNDKNWQKYRQRSAGDAEDKGETYNPGRDLNGAAVYWAIKFRGLCACSRNKHAALFLFSIMRRVNRNAKEICEWTGDFETDLCLCFTVRRWRKRTNERKKEIEGKVWLRRGEILFERGNGYQPFTMTRRKVQTSDRLKKKKGNKVHTRLLASKFRRVRRSRAPLYSFCTFRTVSFMFNTLPSRTFTFKAWQKSLARVQGP